MLSDGTRQWLVDNDLYESEADGAAELIALGADPRSAFVDFYSHVGEATVMGDRPEELDGIVWMIRNSGWADTSSALVSALGLPAAFVPLTPFEGGGYFADLTTGAVWNVEPGERLIALQERRSAADWAAFEDFLIWFFEIG